MLGDLSATVGCVHCLWSSIGIGKPKDSDEICCVIEVVGVETAMAVTCCINTG